jgi:hypothetical protein
MSSVRGLWEKLSVGEGYRHAFEMMVANLETSIRKSFLESERNELMKFHDHLTVWNALTHRNLLMISKEGRKV